MRCGGGHSTVPAVQRASVRWREAEGGGGRRSEAEEEGVRGHRSRSAQLERRWLVVRVTVDLVDGSHVVGDLAGLEHAGHRLRHPVVQRVSPKEQELRLCLRSTYNAYTMPKRSPKPVSRIARVSVDEWAHGYAGRGRGGAGGGGQRTAPAALRRMARHRWVAEQTPSPRGMPPPSLVASRPWHYVRPRRCSRRPGAPPPTAVAAAAPGCHGDPNPGQHGIPHSKAYHARMSASINHGRGGTPHHTVCGVRHRADSAANDVRHGRNQAQVKTTIGPFCMEWSSTWQ